EPVTVTINDKRRRVTKREAIVTQMVDKSTRADLRATKMLIDMLKEAEAKAATASPEPDKLTAPAKLTAPDREVVDLSVARFRRAQPAHPIGDELARRAHCGETGGGACRPDPPADHQSAAI